MQDKLILTHNLGTTGCKAVIYDQRGRVVRVWLSNYRTNYANGNRVEQNSEHWWNAVCESTRNVMRGIHEKSIIAVSFSGQMMGCLCLDKAGKPLQDAFIWADMRAAKESKHLHEMIDESQFYRITGHRISSAYTLSKLLWIKNNQPDIYHRIHKVVQAKDYIVYRLTGRVVTDYTDATGTNLFDLTRGEWSRTILSMTGIERDILPEVVLSTDIVGTVTMDAAEETGLLPGTPVVIGAGDGLCSAIAGTCTQPDDAYLYFGSSAWIGLTKNQPYWDPELRTFNWAHVIPQLYSPCGTMQAAGVSIDWARDQIAWLENSQAIVQNCKTQELVDLEILHSPPGANGLLFLPYLLGERSPYWDPSVKGTLIGLRKKHSRADLLRSFIEGVALNLKIIWDSLQPVITAKELIVVGGQGTSPVNRQIIADVLGIPVKSHNHLLDSKNFGAAILGGIGTGMYGHIDEVKQMVNFQGICEPNAENYRYYNDLLPYFERSYHAVKDVYTEMDKFHSQRKIGVDV